MSHTIVIATKNTGKVAEFAHAFSALDIEVKSLLDYPAIADIVEDGDSFEANAKIKAIETAKLLGVPVLADDSGLTVDALNGAPGIYSARYAGEGATDALNNEKLIRSLQAINARVAGFELDDHSKALSHAQFHCALVLYIPMKQQLVVAHGAVEGIITDIQHGDGGFGYDPHFWLPALNCGMAELSKAQKNEISHRAVALKKLIPLVKEMYS